MTIANGCLVAGSIRGTQMDQRMLNLLRCLIGKVDLDCTSFKKAYRIYLNGKVLYSEQYTRAKKRAGYCVIVSFNGRQFIAIIKYYLVCVDNLQVFPVIEEKSTADDQHLFQDKRAPQLLKIEW